MESCVCVSRILYALQDEEEEETKKNQLRIREIIVSVHKYRMNVVK